MAGRYIYWAMKKEEKRLVAGWTLEPKTFFEKNKAAISETTNQEIVNTPLVSATFVDDFTELGKASAIIPGNQPQAVLESYSK